MRERPILAALISFSVCFYAVMTLTAMAPMNISFLLVTCVFVYLLFLKRFSLPEELTALPEFKNYLWVGGGLFVTCLLSLVVAAIWPIVYFDHTPEITVHGFLKIWYLFCPAVLAAVFLSSNDPRKLLDQMKKWWWITTLFMLLVAIIQFFTGWPYAQPIPNDHTHFHAILFFGHHLSTASILIFPTFVALAHAIGQKRRNQTMAWFAWSTAIAGVLILFLSYARTAWISVPIGILFLVIRYLKPKERWLSITALLALLVACSQVSFIKERIDNSMGVTDRLRLWQANIDFFKHNPLTGIGWLKTQEMSKYYFISISPDEYRSYFWGHAHNNFFEMLGGTGILGVIAFFAWTFFTFKLAYDSAKSSNVKTKEDFELTDWAYGLGVALVLLHINGLTNVTFWEGKVMHQQMFAVSLLLIIRVLQKRSAS